MTYSAEPLTRAAAEYDVPRAVANPARIITARSKRVIIDRGKWFTADRTKGFANDRTNASTSRILVIDGDPERQWLLADAVRRAGDEPAVVRSGAAAVELLREAGAELPAMLVAGLPDGSRRGFVSWARPRFPEVAIVALADDAGEATALYNAGADIVTAPPIDPDLLGAKLGAARRRTRAGGNVA